MARNIFSIYDLSILLKLSILFVGKVKITPFNGSIFCNGSRPFLCGSTALYNLLFLVRELVLQHIQLYLYDTCSNNKKIIVIIQYSVVLVLLYSGNQFASKLIEQLLSYFPAYEYYSLLVLWVEHF
jgi:hypothetical protein